MNGDVLTLAEVAVKVPVITPAGEVVIVAVETVAKVIVEVLALVHVEIHAMEVALVVVGVRLVDKWILLISAFYEAGRKY